MAAETKASAAQPSASEKLADPAPIKKGDYMVHVFLESGSGFVPIEEG